MSICTRVYQDAMERSVISDYGILAGVNMFHLSLKFGAGENERRRWASLECVACHNQSRHLPILMTCCSLTDADRLGTVNFVSLV